MYLLLQSLSDNIRDLFLNNFLEFQMEKKNLKKEKKNQKKKIEQIDIHLLDLWYQTDVSKLI